MPLDLTEAIERTKLLADAGGLLSQESYDLVVSKLDEKDIHAYTMALVDLGIKTRTGSVDAEALHTVRTALYGESEEEPQTSSLVQRLSRAAQALPVEEVYEEESLAEEIPQDPEMVEVREVLESAGIAVSKDGLVNFYQSNIPGLYGERLPQALPLETAVEFWERKLEVADNERHRVQNLQDSLSRLRSQVKERAETNRTPSIDEIDVTLAELEEYGFDPRSRSKTTQGISQALEGVFDVVMGKDWMGASLAVDNAQALLEEYGALQVDNYERDLYIWDALEKLSALKLSDPQAFGDAVGGLGGLAARLAKAAQSAYDTYYGEDPTLEEGPATLTVFLGRSDLEDLVRIYTEDVEGELRGQSPEELVRFVENRLEKDKEVADFICQEWIDEGYNPRAGEVYIDVVDDNTYMEIEYKGKATELDFESHKEVMDILHMVVDGLVEDYLYD